MASVTKSKTVKHSNHFSNEMFETRLNITKASAYFDLSKKQREYIDSYADPFCKTVRLKDGRVMTSEEFKQWWHETFVLPKRKANLEAIIEKRGVCHKWGVSGLTVVTTMKYYSGFNFKNMYFAWYSKEKTLTITLNGRDQKTKISEQVLDCTYPCKSLAEFNRIVGKFKRITAWMGQNAIDLSEGKYQGHILKEIRSKYREPKEPRVRIQFNPPAEPETHRNSMEHVVGIVERQPSTALPINSNLKVWLDVFRDTASLVLMETEYQKRVLDKLASDIDIPDLLPYDMNLIGSLAFIGREIMVSYENRKEEYLSYILRILFKLEGSLHATNLLKQFLMSLIYDGLPLPVGGSLISTIQHSLDQPVHRFGRYDPMFKPAGIVSCYREYARVAFAVQAARVGELPYTTDGTLAREIETIKESIDPEFIAMQYRNEDDGWGHTFNHARIYEILNAIQRFDLPTQ